MSEFHVFDYERSTNPWIERVRAADAEAEHMYRVVLGRMLGDAQTEMAELTDAVFAIAAELRAQRIARRPGAGQT